MVTSATGGGLYSSNKSWVAYGGDGGGGGGGGGGGYHLRLLSMLSQSKHSCRVSKYSIIALLASVLLWPYQQPAGGFIDQKKWVV